MCLVLKRCRLRVAAGDAAAFRALGTTAAELQQWPLSARAFERAAELHAVAVDREEYIECLLLAAKQWLNATAEARAMQRRGRKQQQQQQQALAGTLPQQLQQHQEQQQQVAAADVTTAAAGDGDGAADVVDGSSSSSSGVGVTEDKAAVAVQPGQQQVGVCAAHCSHCWQQAMVCYPSCSVRHFRCAATHWLPTYLSLVRFRSCSRRGDVLCHL